MATLAEILAAADRAEKAGNMEAATGLRAAAARAQITVAPDAVRAAAEKAKAAGNMEAYAGLLAAIGETPAPVPVAPVSQAPGGYLDESQIVAGNERPATPPRPDRIGDTAAAMMEGPVNAARAFAGGLTGGPSPSRDYLANDPLTRGLPGPVLSGLGGLGDLGGAALSGIGAGVSGAIGLATELVPGQGPGDELKLGNDLLGMSMFAVPELAGMPSVAARAATGAGRAVNAAPDPVAAPARSIATRTYTQADIDALAAKAGSGGMGSVKATEELARAARVNLEAKAAADRLGIELPADVFADDEMVRASAGLTRSKVASEAEGAWRNSVAAARDRADEIMAELDGSPDIASVSEKVKASLQATQAELKASAAKLYDEVDAAVAPSARVEPLNVVKALNGTIEELGGIEGLSAAERGLFKLVTGDDQVTYARLLREKRAIGAALERSQGPYGDVDRATLSRLYGALADDQLAAVQAVNPELRDKLRTANQLTAKRKGLEKRIVNAYGKDLDGSIVPALRTAIQQGAKGSIANLNRALKVIPADLRKEAVATALTSISRSARSSQPGFGLTEFAKAYEGIRVNKPVYNAISNVIGPEGMKMLDDLNTVAQRVNQANANVLMTGKANQAGFNQSGLVGNVLQSTAGQRTVRAVGTSVGAVTGGPVGAMAGSEMAVALTTGRTDGILAAGRLFSSPEFTAAAVEAARGAVTPATKAALAKSRPFQSWARVAKVKDPDAWLADALRDVAPPVGTVAAQEAANASGNPYDGLLQRYGGAQ